MYLDRRRFLASLGAATAALATSGSRALAESAFGYPSRLDRIGIQLYTLRRQAAADLAGSLARLASIGYREVEFAGYYGHSAAEIRDFLSRNGIAAPSAHIAIEQIERMPDQTFADAHTIGHEWITVPSLPAGTHVSGDDWKQVAAQFNRVAGAVKAAGLRFAFHNHNDIVRRTGDVLPIDILMHETDPSLVHFQMDIYWAVNGGADPLDLLAKYPGRFSMFHVKDGQRPPADVQTDVGAGTIDFASIFAHGHGIDHYFVESDTAVDPFAFAASSYKYLSALEF